MSSISLIQSKDDSFNRFQSQLMRLLNPFLRKWENWPPTVTASSRPVAGVAQLHNVVCVHDSGQPEQVQICLRKSNGDYEWKTIVQASS